jgi:hypothetical protein
MQSNGSDVSFLVATNLQMKKKSKLQLDCTNHDTKSNGLGLYLVLSQLLTEKSKLRINYTNHDKNLMV